MLTNQKKSENSTKSVGTDITTANVICITVVDDECLMLSILTCTIMSAPNSVRLILGKSSPQSSPLKIDFTVKLRLFNRLFDYQPEASQEFTDGLLENQLQNVSEAGQSYEKVKIVKTTVKQVVYKLL